MPTVLDFLDDPYRVETEAFVQWRDGNRMVLDRTVFYPGVGISPSDSGEIILEDGRRVGVSRSEWDKTKPDVLQHLCGQVPDDLLPGEKVIARIEWPPRYAAMRTHTALHLVSIAFPYPVIHGAVHPGWGSVTFEVDNTGIQPDELEKLVQELVDQDLPVEAVWVLPPMRDRRINLRSFIWPASNGQLRAMKIDDIDLQPCDGLHVRKTAEVGRVRVTGLSRLPGRMYRCDVRLPNGDERQGGEQST
ncbi:MULTISPECIES: hypothetical protein [unclassified Sinorhizobium]|uniref:hypothetical protein n=1 Tax=unclassified Sinorhizobium TaxID=2613772 RepID=UPI0035239053